MRIARCKTKRPLLEASSRTASRRRFGRFSPAAGSDFHSRQLVADHFRMLNANLYLPTLPTDAKTLSLIALSTWLLRDDFFLARPDLAADASNLFAFGLQKLGAGHHRRANARDPDRREEFSRHLSGRRCRCGPKGESLAQAEDRYKSLDSVERERIMKDTRAAELRAREVREKMAAEAARQAAARYNYE